MRVLLDVDTGIDDALALLYATAEPRLRPVGVTAVVGNVAVEVAARNSASVLAVAGRPDVPVAVGAATTRSGGGPRPVTPGAPSNHGVDGLGGVPVPDSAAPLRRDAGALLTELADEGPVTVAALAPLTNVAGYVKRPGVDRIVLVGGELTVDGPPEFNVEHDPAAAADVLAAAVPTTMYAIDVFETVSVAPDVVSALRASRRPAARLAGELLAVRRGRLIGDAAALVLLAHPELFTVERLRVSMLGPRAVPSSTGRFIDVVVAADADAVADAFVTALLAGREPFALPPGEC